MCKIIGYLRVSTDKQNCDGQRLEIEEYCRRNNMTVDEWIEVEMSSRKDFGDRKIDELLNGLRKGDKLVVSELSRLARSMREVHHILHELSKKSIEMHIIKQNIKCTGDSDINTKVLLNSFALAAELERDIISQRVKQGLRLAKSKGVKLGNYNLMNCNNHRKENAEVFLNSMRSIITGLRNNGLTIRKIVDELNNLGVKSYRGGQWSFTTVYRLVKKLKTA